MLSASTREVSDCREVLFAAVIVALSKIPARRSLSRSPIDAFKEVTEDDNAETALSVAEISVRNSWSTVATALAMSVVTSALSCTTSLDTTFIAESLAVIKVVSSLVAVDTALRMSVVKEASRAVTSDDSMDRPLLSASTRVVNAVIAPEFAETALALSKMPDNKSLSMSPRDAFNDVMDSLNTFTDESVALIRVVNELVASATAVPISVAV